MKKIKVPKIKDKKLNITEMEFVTYLYAAYHGRYPAEEQTKDLLNLLTKVQKGKLPRNINNLDL